MTSQEKDKFICEKLGVCWHVPRKEIFIKNDKMECGKCCQWLRIRPAKDGYELTGGYEFINPDFTSEAGRVQLLKLLRDKYNGYGKFLLNSDSVHTAQAMLDDTGKFRDEVFKWLGGKNGS